MRTSHHQWVSHRVLSFCIVLEEPAPPNTQTCRPRCRKRSLFSTSIPNSDVELIKNPQQFRSPLHVDCQILASTFLRRGVETPSQTELFPQVKTISKTRCCFSHFEDLLSTWRFSQGNLVQFLTAFADQLNIHFIPYYSGVHK